MRAQFLPTRLTAQALPTPAQLSPAQLSPAQVASCGGGAQVAELTASLKLARDEATALSEQAQKVSAARVQSYCAPHGPPARESANRTARGPLLLLTIKLCHQWQAEDALVHLRELHAQLLSEHLASAERLEAEVPTSVCVSGRLRSCPHGPGLSQVAHLERAHKEANDLAATEKLLRAAAEGQVRASHPEGCAQQ